MIFSHGNSKHRVPPEPFEIDGAAKPMMGLCLTRRGRDLNFVVQGPDGDALCEVTMVFPVGEYTGPLAVVAHSAEIEVQQFRVTLLENFSTAPAGFTRPKESA